MYTDNFYNFLSMTCLYHGFSGFAISTDPYCIISLSPICPSPTGPTGYCFVSCGLSCYLTILKLCTLSCLWGSTKLGRLSEGVTGGCLFYALPSLFQHTKREERKMCWSKPNCT